MEGVVNCEDEGLRVDTAKKSRRPMTTSMATNISVKPLLNCNLTQVPSDMYPSNIS
jgi:hypothetical protein